MRDWSKASDHDMEVLHTAFRKVKLAFDRGEGLTALLGGQGRAATGWSGGDPAARQDR